MYNAKHRPYNEFQIWSASHCLGISGHWTKLPNSCIVIDKDTREVIEDLNGFRLITLFAISPNFFLYPNWGDCVFEIRAADVLPCLIL